MKKITLTQGKFTKVDDSDYEMLKKHKWMAVKDTKTFYAARHSVGGTRKLIYMHRVVMKTPNELKTDHIDGDGLNNQRENLRICNESQNARNRRTPENNTSGFIGVNWHKRLKKWRAYIRINGKNLHLGYFVDKVSAIKVRKAASLKHYKEFSNIN